jgi:hypothetical protein
MGLAPGTLVTSFNPTAGSSSSAMQVRLSLLRFWNRVITFFCRARSYRQVNNNSSQLKTCTAMRIACCMGIINLARMLLIGLWARLIKSAWTLYSPSPHSPFRDPLPPWIWSWSDFSRIVRNRLWVIRVNSIDKKGKFSRKRLNEDEGDITYINERNRVFNKKVRIPPALFPSCFVLILTTLSHSICRSRGTTINIPQRSGRALSAGRRCEVVGGVVCIWFDFSPRHDCCIIL